MIQSNNRADIYTKMVSFSPQNPDQRKEWDWENTEGNRTLTLVVQANEDKSKSIDEEIIQEFSKITQSPDQENIPVERRLR